MKKYKNIILPVAVIFVALILCVCSKNVLAATQYTEVELKLMREVYELSDDSIKFLSDHNIAASIFPNIPKETLTVVIDHEKGRTWKTDYNDAVKRISMQADAYGFTDEQITALVGNEMPYDHRISIVGPPRQPGREYLDIPATFDVVLNGKVYDSKNCDYPMLYYKEITYLPLTADNLAYLGLSFEISGNTARLKKAPISVDKHSAETTPLWIDPADKPLYIPETNVEVTGNSADGEYPDYPFIMYKSVYYMPMTWEYMHDVLGWQYCFDHENGLVVDSRENRAE